MHDVYGRGRWTEVGESGQGGAGMMGWLMWAKGGEGVREISSRGGLGTSAVIGWRTPFYVRSNQRL